MEKNLSNNLGTCHGSTLVPLLWAISGSILRLSLCWAHRKNKVLPIVYSKQSESRNFNYDFSFFHTSWEAIGRKTPFPPCLFLWGEGKASRRGKVLPVPSNASSQVTSYKLSSVLSLRLHPTSIPSFILSISTLKHQIFEINADSTAAVRNNPLVQIQSTPAPKDLLWHLSQSLAPTSLTPGDL